MDKKETGKNIGIFAGGFVFGTAGLAILGSKGAKKLYAHTTAGLMRAKDCVLNWAQNVQANAGDVAAEAKAINQEIAEKQAAAQAQTHIEKPEEPEDREA